jgi:ArsR family transcriptional regulator
MFKAIASPVRLQMVDLISRLGGQICVCDIESQFELSQPTISHHLKILRKAGIIDCERRGQWIFYFARRDALATLERFLSGVGGG